MMDIAKKVAVVTGGASGLGEATVRAYVSKGARVAIFDLDDKRGGALASELGDAATYYPVDVSNESGVKAALQQVIKKFGELHICNNYAGIAPAIKTLGKDGPHPFDAYAKVININLLGTFNVSRMAAHYMALNLPYNKEGGRGVIINTASVAAYEGQVGQVAYSASKGGVVAMTLPMARDLAPFGIRVNTIVPGLIHTPLCDGMPDALYQSLTASIVYPKRMGRPEEIAHLSVFIAENEYMNGECIRLDGALRLQPR